MSRSGMWQCGGNLVELELHVSRSGMWQCGGSLVKPELCLGPACGNVVEF